MDFDDLDNSSTHGDNRHQPPRHTVALSGSDELEENLYDLRDRDTASNTGSAKRTAVTDGDQALFNVVKHRRKSPSMTEYSEMKQRILALERQLAASSTNGDETSISGRLTGTDTRSDLGVIFENGIQDSVDQQEIIPELCSRTWAEFMNKNTTENKEYAIEVLLPEPDYYNQKKTTAKPDRKHGKSRGAVSTANNKTEAKHPERPSGQNAIPSRIRINSTPILKTLKTLDERIDATASMLMMRPFKFLVHFEPQIKEAVRLLEQPITRPEMNTFPPGLENGNTSDPTLMRHEESFLAREKEVRQETLEHMRCVLTFMDRYIRPTLAHLEDKSNTKIEFLNLWYIFKPGDDIHMPLRVQDTSVTVDALETTPETFQSRYNQLWRVTGTSGGRPNLAAAQSRNLSLRSNPFRVSCYYIDFHGRYYRPTVHRFEIMPFKGERDITSLEFYPARYMDATHQKETLKAQLEKGKVVFDSMARSFTHFFYSGPTLMVHPCGCKIEDGPPIQEHIESEVIVDFKMTLRKYPSWQPPREPWKDPVIERGELEETNPVQYWTDQRRTRLESTEYDQVYNDYFIDRERATIFRDKETIFAPIPSGWLSNESMVPDNDIMLYPGRVFAFVLRTRTFAPLWLWGLQPIKAKTEGLDNLQLKDNTFKDTLQALVKTHFMQRQAQHLPDFEYDIVRGKGRGLVILLHGAPGVGKTFTAGDLGLKPNEVDAALKETFHYAQHWKCVLLLDECDIFLTQRSRTDVKRNALVSIFLRVLEFYTGVLFLTTNRVGALDEAIKSRITWISYYPPLNWAQTREIWKTNIKRVEKGNRNLDVDKNGIMKYAKQHFKRCMTENAAWNGRRIQNAFKVALALANWEAYSKEEQLQTDQLAPVDDDHHPRSTLSARHLRLYETGTRAFDSYVQSATGFTDADRAFHAMERADDYEPEENTPLISPGDGNLFPTFLASPHEELRRAASMSLVPPPTVGHARAPSPNVRPPLPGRLSSGQLVQHQRSSTFSRQNSNGTPNPAPLPRRRSSQLNNPGSMSSPVLLRPPNEHRGSMGYEFNRPHYADPEDIGTHTDETDSHDDGDALDDSYSSDN